MASISLLGIIVVALVLMYLVGGFAFGAVGLLGALLINSILGFILLYLANVVGIKIPINILTILAVVIFGLAGFVVLVLLALFGIYDGGKPGKR